MARLEGCRPDIHIGCCCRKDKGFIPIVKYGEEFAEAKKGKRPRQPVKLLYSSGNHYDLLLPSLI